MVGSLPDERKGLSKASEVAQTSPGLTTVRGEALRGKELEVISSLS